MEDRSIWDKGPGAFFTERPRQASRVIDALLSDPDWKDRIATDAKGPRIGVLGHSAGGFTALALAGGQSDLSRIGAHCEKERADDPLFCSMGRTGQPSQGQPSQGLPALAPITDKRVRAVVAMAPMGVVFTASSLAGIDIPVSVYAAQNDRHKPVGKPAPGAQARPAGHRRSRQQDGSDRLGRYGTARGLPGSSGDRLRAAGNLRTTSLGRRERRA